MSETAVNDTPNPRGGRREGAGRRPKSPSGERLDYQINVRLTANDAAELRHVEMTEGVEAQDYVRRLIRDAAVMRAVSRIP